MALLVYFDRRDLDSRIACTRSILSRSRAANSPTSTYLQRLIFCYRLRSDYLVCDPSSRLHGRRCQSKANGRAFVFDRRARNLSSINSLLLLAPKADAAQSPTACPNLYDSGLLNRNWKASCQETSSHRLTVRENLDGGPRESFHFEDSSAYRKLGRAGRIIPSEALA